MIEQRALENLVGLLQRCRREKNLGHAKHLHAYLHRHQLDTHGVLGSFLISTLVDCGSLAVAQQVFDQLADRNEHAWTSLISGYCTHGELQHAFHLYHQMRHDHVQPSSFTLVSLLTACVRLKDVEQGSTLHTDIIKIGLETDLFIGSTVVDLYAKCGSLLEAYHSLTKLPVRGAASWNALIAAYTEYGAGEEALSCFEQMQLDGVSPSDISFACTLKACGSIGALERGESVCSEIVQKGWEKDTFVGTAMVDMYAKCGSLAEAHKMFDQLSNQNVVSWTALIQGYTDHGYGEGALKCYKQMQLENYSPVSITFVYILKACSNLGYLELGQEIHGEITLRGFESDPAVANTLVDMYSKCGSICDGLEVFYKLPVKNVASWATMINGYGEIQKGNNGVQPNSYLFVAILKACTNSKNVEEGRVIHSEVIKKGCEDDLFIGSSLVDFYCKCSFLVDAHQVLNWLPSRDAVSWNALIAGYAEHGFCAETLSCFTQMQSENVSPVAITYTCSLKACSIVGALEMGQEIHAEITRRALEGDVSLGNTLIDMYAKCGLLAEGQCVFNKLPIRDVVSWNALIKGYGENHEGLKAVECFEDMQEQGVKPDVTTFTCLLAACSHSNLVSQGQDYFKIMKEQHDIEPVFDHFACMVDLLGRSGDVHEAEKFADSMHCLVSEGIQRALLTACKIHGEVELALRCFQHLVMMNKEDASSYMLLADIYTSAGRWNDAKRLEELRKHAGAKKKAASACIELNKELQEFVVGKNHSEDASRLLESLSSHMKDDGYVPNLDTILAQISSEGKKTHSLDCISDATVSLDCISDSLCLTCTNDTNFLCN